MGGPTSEYPSSGVTGARIVVTDATGFTGGATLTPAARRPGSKSITKCEAGGAGPANAITARERLAGPPPRNRQ